MDTTLAPWTIKQIHNQLTESFSQCTTKDEQTLWRVYAKQDCLRILNGRKPTPIEQVILDKFNIIL